MQRFNDELLDRMANDWDARISNDYLGWMNDRVNNDDELWETGKRDFATICHGHTIGALGRCCALELGCGVGRLLRPASNVFKEVHGVDISAEALDRARVLLKDKPVIKLSQCKGDRLGEISDKSFDFVYSFGVIINLPVSIFAGYLLEINRILKPDGCAVLQVFLGKGQLTFAEDTVAYRSYPQKNFCEAVNSAGFNILSLTEHDVGIPIPDDGLLRSYICCIAPSELSTKDSVEAISQILLPGGESKISKNWSGSYTEYNLSVLRGYQLLRSGDVKKAHQVLSFAISRYASPDPEVLEIFDELSAILR